MIKVKNVRPGILILADAGLKLAPGETADVENITIQMQRCLDDGLLARVDVEPEVKSEVKSKSKPSARTSAAKTETKEQSSKTDESGAADENSESSDSGKSELQPNIPGVTQ